MIRVYCDIVGDLFHIGHLNLFKQSRGFGDYLLVGVHKSCHFDVQHKVPIELGIMKYAKYTQRTSTSKIIERILTEMKGI